MGAVLNDSRLQHGVHIDTSALNVALPALQASKQLRAGCFGFSTLIYIMLEALTLVGESLGYRLDRKKVL